MFRLGRIDACPRNVESRRAGAAARDTSPCTRDQLCRIHGGLNQALHVYIQPSWVILSFFISTRWFPLIVVALLSAVWRKQSVVLEPREKATERNRDDRFEEREDDGTSRQGESYWFFRTSDRTRTRRRRRRRRRKRIGKRSPKKDSEKQLRGWDEKSFRSSLFRWPSVETYPVPVCCHGNSLDSRGE